MGLLLGVVMAVGVDTGGGQDRECGDSTANWVDSLEE